MKGRKTVVIENGIMRAEVLPGGGHLGSVSLLRGTGSGINPLWEVPWKSMEPADFQPSDLDAYGGPPEGRLLASIMGHNPCLAWFGAPSAEEAAQGLVVHGEAPVATWGIASEPGRLVARVSLPYAGLDVERVYSLAGTSQVLRVETSVTNLGAARQIGWQEHPTFSPPFLEGGVTAFDASATWGMTDPNIRTGNRLKPGTEFTWPVAPGADGKPVNLRVFPAGGPSGDFTTQLVDPAREWGWFTAVNPRMRLLCGYAWGRKESPWLGHWEENRARTAHPWDGRTVTRGMEFGVSPFAHGKEAMVKLGSLRGVPTLADLPAGGKRERTFLVFLSAVPEGCQGVRDVAVRDGTVAVTLLSGEPLNLK